MMGIGLRLIALLAVVNLNFGAYADEIDSFVSSEMQQRHIPGVSLVVLKDGKVIKSKGYGLANVELNVAVTSNTVFQIQSITKPFTAMAILMLAEKGRLDLDDPISKHLTGTPETWKPITIRHLLTHTSGIKDFINEPTTNLRLDLSEEDVLKNTAPRPLNFAPGEKYSYSNTGYHLLAMVIRKLTGQSYGQFLEEHIFRPLQMTNTRVVSLRELISNRAAGYFWQNGKLHNGDFIAESILAYGGGGICSTAEDLAKWDAAIESGKLISPDSLKQMWTPALLSNGKPSSYGLGWGIRTVKNHRQINHTGAHATGFSSGIGHFPEDRVTVIFLSNLRGLDSLRIMDRIAGFYVPDLVPQKYNPIPDSEPQLADLARSYYLKAAQGALDAELFTADFWKELAPRIDEIRKFVASFGTLESLSLVERKEEKGNRLYRYRIQFKHLSRIAAFTFTTGNKIAAVSAEEE